MPKYKDINGKVHDIDDGFEQLMPGWPASYTPLTDAEADSLEHPSLTDAQRTEILKISAQVALDATDLVAFRCFKANVAYPAKWQQYTSALRSISNGTDTRSTSLPVKPAYPEGT